MVVGHVFAASDIDCVKILLSFRHLHRVLWCDSLAIGILIIFIEIVFDAHCFRTLRLYLLATIIH